MNILQVVPELNVGGVETGTIDMAKYLNRQGHKCIVVSAGGGLVSELERCGIKHYKLPVENKAFWVMLKAAVKLAKIIKEEDIDIVHGRSRVPAWIGFMAARQTNTLFITTAHGYYSKHIFSYIMGAGKYTIVPSSIIGKHMIESFRVPLENIRLIPRSVDLERYHFKGISEPKKEFVIGVIGRIAPIKGQIYFIKSLAKILRAVPSVKARIVGGVSPGKDSYMEELEVWVRRLGLSNRIEFLGTRHDIPQILSGLDVLVMPSIVEESFGRVIVEAQAVGVPVVATKVGGVVEIIENEIDGLLVHPKDHEVLADAVIKILKDPVFAQTLAKNGRKKVEDKFSLEKMAQDTVKVYEEALSKKRILVIKISAIGDAILSIPSFKALKKEFPFSHITCLTGISAKDVFARCPYIDELIICDFKNKDKGIPGIFKLVKKLMRRRFDFVIDLQNNKNSHILSYGTFSPVRYGYHNGKFSFLLNHKIKNDLVSINPVAHQFRVLKMLGIDYSGETLELWPSDEDKQFADNFFQEHGVKKELLIGLNIGASPRWQSKRWLVERFSEVCDRFAKKGYKVLITGSSLDASFATKVIDKTAIKPICAVGRTTLMQLACLIQRCNCFVTSDSAPMHIASAMKVPFVALFGPTDAKRHLFSSGNSVVLQKGCLPCYKDVCKKKTYFCMKEITVDDVVGAIESLLNPREKK